ETSKESAGEPNSGNGFVRVTLSDDGRGIPKKILDKIFDPFFTTKPEGVGTGLGLSVSLGIIKDHNGNIEVKSVENEGTSFNIQFPCHQIN
ncbi:MAG: ATP-binding protein, partial [Thermodesulfobacteriota bacterium]